MTAVMLAVLGMLIIGTPHGGTPPVPAAVWCVAFLVVVAALVVLELGGAG